MTRQSLLGVRLRLESSLWIFTYWGSWHEPPHVQLQMTRTSETKMSCKEQERLSFGYSSWVSPVWEEPGSSNSRCLNLRPERGERCVRPAEPSTAQLLAAMGADVKLWFNGIAFTNHMQGSGFPNEHCTLLWGSVTDQHCHTDSVVSLVAFERLSGNDLWSQSMRHVRNSGFKMLLTSRLASSFWLLFWPTSILFIKLWLDAMW